jgi:hypothetical protein
MKDTDSPADTCRLCDRQVPRDMITLHHLKPKEQGGKPEHRTPLCRPCHKQLHAVYSNKTLARSLDRIDLLKNAPELQTFLAWIRKQRPDRNFQVAMSNGNGGGRVRIRRRGR